MAADEPVFVVDLTSAGLEEARRASDSATPPEPLPSPIDETPSEPISRIALLVDGRDEPLLLPVEPTRDVAFLDLLGRLLKIAVLAGQRIPALALAHGEEAERRAVFERRLPTWAYDGLPDRTAATLPPPVRKVLGPRR